MPTYHLIQHSQFSKLIYSFLIFCSFLKDLINGVKKFVKSDRMRHLAIPQYETLKVIEMIKYADEHPEC